jgi:hypothetical protein
MTAPLNAPLDLSQAGRMVEAALAAAQISAGERARAACAKTLVRLAPPPAAAVRPANFDDALRELGGEDRG